MTLSLRKSLTRGVLLASVATLAVSAGQSHAATKNLLDANLNTYTVTIGDYVYSGFSFTGFTAAAGDTFVTSGAGGVTQIALSFDPTRTANTSGSYTYTISLLNGRTFNQANVGYVGSDLSQPLTLPSYQTALNSSALSTSPSIGPQATASGTSSTLGFNLGFTTQAFTQTFGYTAGDASFLNTVNATISSTAQGTVPTGTPGPLPLLGAGAAFGFSRKLRHRIKAAI
jgi:hypothetical protein